MMDNKEYAFELTPELCIQCHACESACKNWRHTENFLSWRKVHLVEEGQFPNIKVHYYSVACMHCVNPACMKVCPVKAISKNEKGIVLVDSEKCIGCKLCQKACPYDIPVFGKDRKMQKCDMCAGIMPEEQQSPCVRMCPTRALKRVMVSVEEKQKMEDEYLRKLQMR